MADSERSRRAYLTAFGVTTSIAGCLRGGDGGVFQQPDSETPSETPSEQPSQTPPPTSTQVSTQTQTQTVPDVDPEFGEAVYQARSGSTVEISVILGQNQDAYFQFGEVENTNIEVVARIEDTDGSGEITVVLDTSAFDDPESFIGVSDGDDYTIIDSQTPPVEELAATNYTLLLGDNTVDDPVDVSTLTLT